MQESTPGTAGEFGHEDIDGACATRSSAKVGSGGRGGDSGRRAGMGANAHCCGRDVLPHKLHVLCVATVTDAKSSLSRGETGCGVH